MPLFLLFLLMALPAASQTSQPRAAPPGDPVRGLALLTNFRDSLPRHSGNGLRCVSCHLENGTRASAMPWLGSVTRYPRFRARPGYEETMERRVNECIARSLAGRMLHEDSREMRDMVAYLETLRDRPRPSGVDTVRLAGNVARGRRTYAGTCARCHGPNGQGLPTGPALWGTGSFSIGAGMARQSLFATFVRHNMPFDHAVTLTDQQAADVAAFVLVQPRQDHPGKERDWPKGDAPADIAYATTGTRAAGRTVPPARPLLRRRVAPDSLAPMPARRTP
ncbi:MAG: c-type cytochrome [Gemmatimonadetes bacterium]|nr:c-type cytochrome [Gemmatimonadota bacterium]